MKKLYSFKLAALIIFQCALATALFAQAPLPKQWDKRFGGSSKDELHSVQQTADGGYILGGASLSENGGDKTETSRGQRDYWIVKVDAKGIKQWDKRFGGASSDVCNYLQQTRDGGYILGGSSASGISGDKTEARRGGTDYWVVKIDAHGIKQWDKRFGGTSADYLFSIQQTTDGGYILGGNSNSGIGGDKTEGSRGGDDYWVLKIDMNGTKQWDKCFGGDGWDLFEAIHQTTDGGYIFGGESASNISGDVTESNKGGWGTSDYWMVKIDANGIKQWDKRFGGTNSEDCGYIQQTTEGGYIIGGSSYSELGGDVSQPNWDNDSLTIVTCDYWVVKTDENGTKQWDKRFGGTASEILLYILQTADKGYILGGYSDSPISGDITQPNRGIVARTSDYWVIKIDSTGLKEWNARYGGSESDYLYSLQQTTDAGYILGGYSGSGISSDKTQDSRGQDDYWIVKLGCPPNTTIISSGRLDICQTGSVQLQAYSAGGYKYQWVKNGQKIRGATDSVYTATQPGKYQVVVYTSRECADISKPVWITNSCGKTENNISVSPNPSHGNITIAYNSNTTGNIHLNVYDKTGKLMFTKTEYAIKGNNTYQLYLSNLINGVYNLQINNNNGQQQVTFIIEK